MNPGQGGRAREVTAAGTTVAAAERALREKLVDRTTPTQQAITADTTIATLATMWLEYLRDESRIEATTINEYERVLTRVVIPECAGLRLQEVTTSRLDLFSYDCGRPASAGSARRRWCLARCSGWPSVTTHSP